MVTRIMTEREQAMAFAEDLERLVWRYRDEFDITVANLVGVLECAKYEVLLSAGGDDDEFEITFED
jgi:hypothetical protein